MVVGYNPVPCRTNEGGEGLVIQVGIQFGLLARNLSIQFETLDGSAVGESDPIITVNLIGSTF